MENQKTRYTSDEIFAIFKEQTRLYVLLDKNVDQNFVLERNTDLIDWHDALDAEYKWYNFARFLNLEFRLNIELDVWKKVLKDGIETTVGDVCDFLSKIAEKEQIKPVKRFGSECLSAAIFLTLKLNLKNKRVDVSELRPSTPLSTLNKNDLYPIVEEVTRTGVRVFESFSLEKIIIDNPSKFKLVRFFLPYKRRKIVNAGDIQTFRDLVERIVEGEALTA